MPTTEDLVRQIDRLLIVWDSGLHAYKTGWGINYERPSTDQVLDVMPAVLRDIAAHRNRYRIHMRNYDSNKTVNYVAWHIKEQHGGKFPTAPLFYGHLHFLDETRSSVSLYSIPELPSIAENLELFHIDGHKMAPYTFIKGVDLTFTYCLPDGK